MSSTISSNLSTIQQNPTSLSLGTLCKSLAISGLISFLFYTFLFNHPNYRPSDLSSTINQKWPTSSSIISTNSTKTNISHIVFGIVGSMNTWSNKKSHIEAWWRPNVTRGYLFLDRPPTEEFQPWPSTSPPFGINEDVNKLKVFPKISKPIQVRIELPSSRSIGNKVRRLYREISRHVCQ